MDPPTSSGKVEAPPRQKRVLPLRSRRGGPGIGSCDADVMILDMQKRKENDLLPLETRFLLTTNSSLVPSSSSSLEAGSSKNTNERYLDRPGILKACHDQEIIQTPEFYQLSEVASVGTRFRPREIEDPATDTSDAAYERRHRKYEMSEKRQRLREKEKLQHEHYKLKERIEQLRAMDSAAFLSLPSASFSVIPGRSNDEGDEEHVSNLLGTYPDAITEGERRRKEMLELALTLEERYKVLLRKDKKGNGKSGVIPQDEQSSEVIGNGGDGGIDGDESVEGPDEAPAQAERQKIKLKIKISSRNTSTSFIARQRDPSSVRTRKSSLSLTSPLHESSSPWRDGNAPQPSSSPSQTRKRKNNQNSDNSHQRDTFGASVSAPPQYSPSRQSHSGEVGKAERTTCRLMVAAMRNASPAKKTQRQVMAFGVKVPHEVEELREYAIPWWLIEDDDPLLERMTDTLDGTLNAHPSATVAASQEVDHFTDTGAIA